MDSSNQSPLFPAGTLMVAYKGESLGGARELPQWQIEAVIDEKRYFRSPDFESELAVTNSIDMEFEALDPRYVGEPFNLYLNAEAEFGDGPGELTFMPLDPEKRSIFYFPRAVLRNRKVVKGSNLIRWKFKILFNEKGVFMAKLKTANHGGDCMDL